MNNTTYNGWKNRETWNVSLWINNDEPLYRWAVLFMKAYKGKKPYKDFVSTLDTKWTPDHCFWISPELSYKELNAMMREINS